MRWPWADATGTIVERFKYDAHGNAAVLTDLFDSRSSSVYDWEFRYTGRREDLETGLYFFRARYYHSSLGRFTSRDPLGFVDGMSLYHGYFVPGDTDPSGMDIRCGIKKPGKEQIWKDPTKPLPKQCHYFDTVTKQITWIVCPKCPTKPTIKPATVSIGRPIKEDPKPPRKPERDPNDPIDPIGGWKISNIAGCWAECAAKIGRDDCEDCAKFCFKKNIEEVCYKHEEPKRGYCIGFAKKVLETTLATCLTKKAGRCG